MKTNSSCSCDFEVYDFHLRERAPLKAILGSGYVVFDVSTEIEWASTLLDKMECSKAVICFIHNLSRVDSLGSCDYE